MDTFATILVCVIVICVVGLCIYGLLKKGKERQVEIILEWLLLAVIKAEKELGSGTGQIKLRFVYDLFIDKFKVVSYFMSFSQFSILVDQALDIMKDMVSNNKKIEEYIAQ